MNKNKQTILSANDIVSERDRSDDAVVINKDGLDVKKSGNIIIGTLNVFSKPFKDRHEKHYKESKFHLVADFLFVLVIIVLGISLYKFVNLEPNIGVSLEVLLLNEKAVSAEMVNFEIKFKNETERRMDEVFISLDYPENFEVVSVLPDSDFDSKINTLSLGSLESGANGSVQVEGFLLGSRGARQNFSSTISFRDDGKERRALSSLTYSIEESLLEFKGVLPKEVYQEVDVSGSFEIKNTSKMFFDNVKIVLKSDSFKILSFGGDGVLTSENDESVINVGEMNPGDEKNIQIILSSKGLKKDSQIEFELVGEKNKKNFLQDRILKDVGIKESKLQVSLYLENEIIKLDSEMKYKIVLKNTEDRKIDNLSLSFSPTNKNFELGKVNFYEKSGTIKDGTLVFNSLEINEDKEFEMSVEFKKIAEAKNQMTGLMLVSRYRITDNKVKKIAQSDNRKINSELFIKSDAFYYSEEGDQYGIGPLPPVVGIPTSYNIVWEVHSSGNDLNDFELRARLGEGAIFTTTKSLLSGNLEYNEKNREVVWRIDRIKALSDVNKANFQVSVIPQIGDVGKSLVLLVAPEYTAQDNYTTYKYVEKLGNVDTELENDKYVDGTGVVRESY